MQSGLGQPKPPRRGRQDHPGLERPQREGGDRDMKTRERTWGLLIRLALSNWEGQDKGGHSG